MELISYQTFHYSLFIIRYSLFVIRYSLFGNGGNCKWLVDAGLIRQG
ncbi:Putative uncharacterized protein [Moritella viscosa]|uniref:Uncharacterized protein n=1 Tax=Moritella viscosa TaxID=80854 RepID=A0ABY1HKH1_9GAMM|nr:Putative uncharacterized protein [Moritella viscosa]SGZ18505.1 Putative uncharacterized protein [Moritella viscosa]SHO28426.1 Putative uncharacterized protein [Moritella viscosa]